jgi:2,7-dihydroxy-5-methyl-1-naphthoate 7-O-methyltransferase
MPDRQAADLEALADLCTPWCVRVAATLRIADLIAAGTAGVRDLAAQAGCDAGALDRVLRHLVSKGVFEQAAPGTFALNEAAEGLRGTSPGYDLDGIGGRMAQAWGSLLGAVRTGRPAYHEILGMPFWEDLNAHPDVAASFDQLMGVAGHGTPDPQILLSDDWAPVRSVVDVGGGTGALLAEILRVRPGMRGILVDLPRTVTRSADVFRAAGVVGRVTAAGQSFFDPLPAGADLYLLKNVLADWPDREATAILTRCAEAARPAGRVVILGGVSAGEHGEAAPELLMMVLLGGKDRTLDEFGELARQAGLEVSVAGRLPSGRFAVECRPAGGHASPAS